MRLRRKMNTAGAQAKIGEGIYTAADAARILNIPYSQANYWFKYYLKEAHFKTRYRYYFAVSDIIAVNFLTLIEMYVFYAFKKEKVKTKLIVDTHGFLSGLWNTHYPFAQESFYVSGGKIWYGNEHILVSATPKQQLVFPQILIPFSKKITFSDTGAYKYYPLGKDKTVVVDPQHQFGQPVIEGTNILTTVLYNLHLGGEKSDFIARLYGITLANVKDAIEFSEIKLSEAA